MRAVVAVLAVVLLLATSFVHADLPPPPPVESESAGPAEPAELSNAEAPPAAPNSYSGLAGMGIAVVLRNRNNIRTIVDKSAEHVEREESRKQAAMEQSRKDKFRNQAAQDEAARRAENDKQDRDAEDRREQGVKAQNEQRLKQTEKEAQERRERRNEMRKKQQDREERETEERKKRQEQEDKERKKRQQEQEDKTEQQNKKNEQQNKENQAKDEQRKKGLLREQAWSLVAGTVLRDASQISFSGAYTYMFWIYPKGAVGPWANIMHKGTENVNRNPAVWFYPGNLRLHVRSGNQANPTWDNGGNHGCDPEDQLPVGAWTHVAITHDSSGIRVFLNGNVRCSTNYGGPVANNGPLYVSDPWHQAANANIADFRYIPEVVATNVITQAVQDRKGI